VLVNSAAAAVQTSVMLAMNMSEYHADSEQITRVDACDVTLSVYPDIHTGQALWLTTVVNATRIFNFQ
jgi:hypothetical protein